MKENAKRVVLAIGLAILLSGCDPGYLYRPHSETCAAGENGYECMADGIEVVIHDIGGLDANRFLSHELGIRNRRDESLKVMSIEIVVGESKSITYDLTTLSVGSESILPDSETDLTLLWRLDDYPSRYLGRGFDLKLAFEGETGVTLIEVGFESENG